MESQIAIIHVSFEPVLLFIKIGVVVLEKKELILFIYFVISDCENLHFFFSFIHVLCFYFHQKDNSCQVWSKSSHLFQIRHLEYICYFSPCYHATLQQQTNHSIFPNVHVKYKVICTRTPLYYSMYSYLFTKNGEVIFIQYM